MRWRGHQSSLLDKTKKQHDSNNFSKCAESRYIKNNYDNELTLSFSLCFSDEQIVNCIKKFQFSKSEDKKVFKKSEKNTNKRLTLIIRSIYNLIARYKIKAVLPKSKLKEERTTS